MTGVWTSLPDMPYVARGLACTLQAGEFNNKINKNSFKNHSNIKKQ